MLYLMRHGQTIWNLQTRLQGRKDSPLTALGVAQAEAFGRSLQALLPDPSSCRVVSSPQPRAWSTAVLAVTAMGGDPSAIAHDARLMEHAFGLWEGLLWSEVQRDHKDSLDARMADRWNTPAPGGESYADVAARVRPWLASLDPDATVLAFSHGVTTRVIRGLYAGLSEADTMALKEPQDKIFVLDGGRLAEIAV